MGQDGIIGLQQSPTGVICIKVNFRGETRGNVGETLGILEKRGEIREIPSDVATSLARSTEACNLPQKGKFTFYTK